MNQALWKIKVLIHMMSRLRAEELLELIQAGCIPHLDRETAQRVICQYQRQAQYRQMRPATSRELGGWLAESGIASTPENSK